MPEEGEVEATPELEVEEPAPETEVTPAPEEAAPEEAAPEGGEAGGGVTAG